MKALTGRGVKTNNRRLDSVIINPEKGLAKGGKDGHRDIVPLADRATKRRALSPFPNLEDLNEEKDTDVRGAHCSVVQSGSRTQPIT